MSEFPPSPANLPPDLLEAYQELRIEFWGSFKKHSAAVKNKPGSRLWPKGEHQSLQLFPAESPRALIGLTAPKQIGDGSDQWLEGTIDVVIDDSCVTYGLGKDGIAYNRQIDFNTHGLSEAELSKVAPAEFGQRVSNFLNDEYFTRQMVQPDLAPEDKVRQLSNWLISAEPLDLDDEID